MAGIYIHWPFCVQRCIYCDFHSSVRLQQQQEVFEGIIQELQLRQHYLKGDTIDTIYFGGGTPSLLSPSQIKQLLQQIHDLHPLSNSPEITLESNPDDWKPEYLEALRNSGVNRLSIGIQSFHDQELSHLHRRHNAQQAQEVVQQARKQGFDNLSIDLIYGLPNSNMETWSSSLEIALELDVEHLSAYHLTYEPCTLLYSKQHLPTCSPISEDNSLQQFKHLIQRTKEQGYEHYEISNFAKPNRYSKHNTAYWSGTPYLGIGPSAHSYNGHSRQWNVAHNSKYTEAIHSSTPYFEVENLTKKEQYNELILTSLRTMWGLNLDSLNNKFGASLQSQLLKDSETYLNEGYLIKDHTNLVISESGKMIADQIMSDLMWVD